MTACKRCGGEYGVEDLVRHEDERCVRVHCPDCKALLGTYRKHGQRP